MSINPFARRAQQSGDADAETVKESLLNEVNEAVVKEVDALAGDDGFAELLAGDDEETYALQQARTNSGELAVTVRGGVSIERELEANLKALRKRYPMGGIKTSRFITTDVLLRAPDGYFSKYDDVVKQGVTSVQTAISDGGRSDVIGASQADPTNEALQDDAYRVVHSMATDFMDKTTVYHSIERAIIMSLISNEIIGFGQLDPLWRDKQIDEILCNGPHDIQVEIKGKLLRVPGVKFRDSTHLMNLIERLYGAIGKVLSHTTPIQSGNLHDKSRMEAVHTTVAPEGPNFSIRRHREGFITPNHIIGWGTASEELLTDLGNLIYKGASWLIIGGTSTGKTTLLNALTGYLRPDSRILTLEDTIEMKPHPKKLVAAAMGCLPPRPDRPEDMGVTMRDLVKTSLRLRPDTILVGEVRDGAAYDLCQALNTGHAGCSTVHANSEYDAIYRMVSLVSQGGLMTGNQALPLIAAAFDFIVLVEHFPMDGSRKIVSISEVAPYPVLNEMTGEQHLPTHPIWKFRERGIENDKVVGDWEKVGEISEVRRKRLRLDLEKELTWEDLTRLSKI